jgi:hypothetical protein
MSPQVTSGRGGSDSSSSIDDDAASTADESLKVTFDIVERWEAEHTDAPHRNRLYYFAMPSELYPPSPTRCTGAGGPWLAGGHA